MYGCLYQAWSVTRPPTPIVCHLCITRLHHWLWSSSLCRYTRPAGLWLTWVNCYDCLPVCCNVVTCVFNSMFAAVEQPSISGHVYICMLNISVSLAASMAILLWQGWNNFQVNNSIINQIIQTFMKASNIYRILIHWTSSLDHQIKRNFR